MRSPDVKKMFSNEKDLGIKLRGNTNNSGKRSKILEEARGPGEAGLRQERDTAPPSLEEKELVEIWGQDH